MKMKKWLIAGVATAATLTLVGCDQGSDQAPVAVVDMEKLADTPSCTTKMQALQSQYGSKMQSLQAQIESAEQDDDAVEEQEALMQKYEQLQEEVQIQVQKAQRSCIDTIRSASQQVAKKHGYQVVFPSQGAVYVNDSVNITSEVKSTITANETAS